MTNSVSIVQVECLKSDEVAEAKIYAGEKLKTYEIAVNCAAEELARQNPQLMLHRGKSIFFDLKCTCCKMCSKE